MLPGLRTDLVVEPVLQEVHRLSVEPVLPVEQELPPVLRIHPVEQMHSVVQERHM